MKYPGEIRISFAILPPSTLYNMQENTSVTTTDGFFTGSQVQENLLYCYMVLGRWEISGMRRLITSNKHYRLIVPDLPGSGRSDLIKQPHHRAGNICNRCKAGSSNQKNIQKAGDDRPWHGGYITLAFAEMYRKNCMHWALLYSGGYKDDEAKIDLRRKAISFIKNKRIWSISQNKHPNLFFDQENKEPLIHSSGKKFACPKPWSSTKEAMIARSDRNNGIEKFHVAGTFS